MVTTFDTLKHKQWLLRIMIFSLVTIMIWVGVSLFRSQQRTGISTDLLKAATPLNPNIDASVIDRIQAKRAFTPEELQDFPVLRIIRLKTGEEKITTETQEQVNSNPSVTTATKIIASPTSSPSASPVVPASTESPSATVPDTTQ